MGVEQVRAIALVLLWADLFCAVVMANQWRMERQRRDAVMAGVFLLGASLMLAIRQSFA